MVHPYGRNKRKEEHTMLTKMGKATFKCKDCGETFETFYTEGGIRAGINLPHCPKCGSDKTKKANIIERIL
jgi:transposase-like protein